MSFFEAKGIRIFNDDFLITNRIEDESIDLSVTSPPYGVDIKYGEYDDGIPIQQGDDEGGQRNHVRGKARRAKRPQKRFLDKDSLQWMYRATPEAKIPTRL